MNGQEGKILYDIIHVHSRVKAQKVRDFLINKFLGIPISMHLIGANLYQINAQIEANDSQIIRIKEIASAFLAGLNAASKP